MRIDQHAPRAERELTFLSLRAAQRHAEADAALLPDAGDALLRPTPAAEQIVADCAELVARVRHAAAERAASAAARIAEASALREDAARELRAAEDRLAALEQQPGPSGLGLASRVALLAVLVAGVQTLAIGSALPGASLADALTARAVGVSLGAVVLCAALGSLCGTLLLRVGSEDDEARGPRLAPIGLALAAAAAGLLTVASAAALASWPLAAPALAVFVGAAALAILPRREGPSRLRLQRELTRARATCAARRRADLEAARSLAALPEPPSADDELRQVVEHFRSQAAAYYGALGRERPERLGPLGVAFEQVAHRLEALVARAPRLRPVA